MSEVMYSIANDHGKNILLLRPQVILNLGQWVKVLRVRRRGGCLAVLRIQVTSLLSWLTGAIGWRALLCECARHGSMYSHSPCLFSYWKCSWIIVCPVTECYLTEGLHAKEMEIWKHLDWKHVFLQNRQFTGFFSFFAFYIFWWLYWTNIINKKHFA